jgi:glutamate dehydrogenase
VPAKLQAAILVESGRALERGTVWLLRNARHPLEIAPCVATYGDGIKALERAEGIVVGSNRARIEARRDDYVKQGVPAELAGRASVLGLLAPSLDIIRLAQQAKAPVETIGRVYFAVGERFALDWLRTAALAISVESHWDKQAIAAIVEDFYGHQSQLTGRIIQDSGGALAGAKRDGGADAIAAWAGGRAVAAQRTDALIADLRQGGNTGLAMLAVANRQLRSLIGD